MAAQEILCVDRAVLERELGGALIAGLTTRQDFFQAVTRVLAVKGEFRARSAVEEDARFVQPIAYGVVTDGERVLALWRKERAAVGKAYVETRHNNQIGLAAGGHIERFDDLALPDFFRRALLRELSEELILSGDLSDTLVEPTGVLFRDETLFDRVHIGLIFRVTHPGQVALPEASDEYERISFLHPTELAPLRDAMEGWGQIIADSLLGGVLQLRSSPVVELSGK